LLRCEPIPEADAESAHALHASNAGGQFRAEQPGVGRLVGDAAHRSESEVDGGWGIVALFEVDPIAEHDRAVEREARFRAVPGDKLPDRMSYVRWPLAEVKLLRTAAFDCSRSGRARTRFGAFLLRGLVVIVRIGDGLHSVADSLVQIRRCAVTHYYP